MRTLKAIFLAGLYALALGAAAAAPNADGIGMVLDLQGSAELTGKQGNSALQLLSYIKVGEQIRLGADARASLSHYESKLIYQLTGPALAEVDSTGIRVLKGPKPVTRSLAEKMVAAALHSRMSPAAMRMRALDDIALLSPRNRGVVLELRPRFTWAASGANTYEVSIDELDGGALVRAQTADKQWQMPAGQALAPGKAYRWTIAIKPGPDGAAASTSAVFSVASDDEREAALALQPRADAGVEEWVLYATLLSARQMHDEARTAWQRIAQQRPDLSAAGTAR